MARPPFAIAARPQRLLGWCAWRLVGVSAVVAAAIAAHLWSAFVRCRSGGLDLLAEVRWSSVWLWVALMLSAWLAYGVGLAWMERDQARRRAARLRRDGAP